MSVVVLGMHRSGTSSVTRLLELAGLATCDPRALFEGSEFNARGNRENRRLTHLNERVLHALDGAWHAPPALPAGWTGDPRLRELRARGRQEFDRTMPRGKDWVWKDPRLCLVLPFWEELLATTPALVFVRRNPIEVAESLRRRNEFPVEVGLALWERYTRSALAAATGHLVVATDYDAVLADPKAFHDTVREVLIGAGQTLDAGADAGALADAMDASLRHADAGDGAIHGSAAVSREQAALYDAVRAIPEVNEAFTPPDAGTETASVTTLLAERAADAAAQQRKRDKQAKSFVGKVKRKLGLGGDHAERQR